MGITLLEEVSEQDCCPITKPRYGFIILICFFQTTKKRVDYGQIQAYSQYADYFEIRKIYDYLTQKSAKKYEFSKTKNGTSQ